MHSIHVNMPFGMFLAYLFHFTILSIIFEKMGFFFQMLTLTTNFKFSEISGKKIMQKH